MCDAGTIPFIKLTLEELKLRVLAVAAVPGSLTLIIGLADNLHSLLREGQLLAPKCATYLHNTASVADRHHMSASHVLLRAD